MIINECPTFLECALKAVAFETQNRNEKKFPSMDECKLFLNKLELLKNAMEKPLIVYGIYFSANGFSDDVEMWLNDNGILTIDFNTWEKVMADL